MTPKISYQIFTGPMEVDWLVAELLYGEEHIGDLIEWGKKIILLPRLNGEPWELPVEDFVEIIKKARERVRYIPDEHSNNPESDNS